MSILGKAALTLAGATGIMTAIVGAKNALEVKSDEEVRHKQGVYEKYVKRPQDFFCSTAATIVLSPVLAGTAILVRKNLGSPVLFTQERPGRNGKVFKLYKFRSMTDEKDENGELLPDEERLTKFGKLLRSTSLDELPELFNIIRGDMAVVGPRPLLIEYLPYYTEDEKHRHDVRPGLSGLAQISGRNATTWEKKFEYDLNYISNITLKNDFKIVLLTIIKAIKREGIQVGKEVEAGRLDDYRRTS